jgi:type IV secretory pathway VirB6-like protein
MSTHDEQHEKTSTGRMYVRFGLMILTSTVLMYVLTYTNVFDLGHIHVSEERIYMAVLMGSAMAIVMLLFMWKSMYRVVRVNIAILVAALLVAGGAFGLSQSQALVGDEAYMKAMIPHHSIAILTSVRANLDDVRVQQLADGIAATQVEEIAEMEWLLADIAANGKATTQEEADRRPVPDFSE